MSLELRQQQKLKLEQKLEQRLELKQQLVQELRLILAIEFQDYISFEEDEDIGLLETSLPFLILHEVSHPLHTHRYVTIPPVELDDYTHSAVCSDETFGDVFHHNAELGIDRSALVIGQKTCGYSLDDMITSHAAITARVFRDVFDKERIPPHYGFIARLDAAVRLHQGMTSYGPLLEELDSLKERASAHIGVQFGTEKKEVYENIVRAYLPVYTGTQVHGPGLKYRGKLPLNGGFRKPN